MAELNCSACEDLRQTSAEFIVNGLTDDMCTSLGNDTGLNPSDDHNDCTDLNNLNDCLVGNMATEIDAYDVCDWKTFMKKYIPNVWTVTHAIICAICGIWTNIHSLWEKVNCIYSGLTTFVNSIAQTTGGVAFVRYWRNNGAGGSDWWETNLSAGQSYTYDMYMDASGASAGSTPADRDYVVIIHNCTNYRHFYELEVLETFYSSGDTRALANIRNQQAQHPTINLSESSNDIQTFSWTASGAVLVKKGEHVKINAYIGYVSSHDNNAEFRLHQFVATWIPVNVSSAIDPSAILTC